MRPTVSTIEATQCSSGLRPAIRIGSTMFSAAVMRRQQVERLEDEADPVAPQQGERLVVERGDLGVAEVHLARRGPVEAGEHVQQGRLAGAGGTHDRGELAPREADADVVERGDGGVAGAVELADAVGPGGGARSWWSWWRSGWCW